MLQCVASPMLGYFMVCQSCLLQEQSKVSKVLVDAILMLVEIELRGLQQVPIEALFAQAVRLGIIESKQPEGRGQVAQLQLLFP